MIEARTVLLATGSKHRKLAVPGEEEFHGKGVSYCATCDAAFFRDKTVAVVGGSDSAAKEALLLSEHAKKVYIIYRREKIRAEPINAERVGNNKKIEVINNTNIVEIKGRQFVESVFLDAPYGGSKELKVDGVFIEIGYLPQNELAKGLGVKLDEKGEIIINRDSETNIPGVYAAGDVTANSFKQAVTAAAQGVIAAKSAYTYVMKQEVEER
jgi:thioredoxin reductase (NADPH)